MRRISVFFVSFVLVLIPSNCAWSQSPAPQVRTDGVYYYCVYSNPGDPQNPICVYVRFYPDGLGLHVLSADKPEQVADWLTKENRAGDEGSYSVSGSTLTFIIRRPNSTTTFTGELTSDAWVLGGDAKYTFFGALPTGWKPGGNRAPIVTGPVRVENSIGLGMTGRQEALTTTVSVNASDPDGDPVTYTWRASNGSLAPAGNRVVWQRPVDFGRVHEGILVVQVEDGKGGKTTRAWVMH